MISRSVAVIVMVAATFLPSAARASSADPATVVRRFYAWYAHQPAIGSHFTRAQPFFDSDLYKALADAYDLGGIDAHTCPEEPPSTGCRVRPYDPFSNASSRAAFYSVGKVRHGGGMLYVPVSVRAAGNVTVVNHLDYLLSASGGAYRIVDIRYRETHFYYAGPITSLLAFLGKFNC